MTTRLSRPSLQNRVWFWRWLANPRVYRPAPTQWSAQIEHMNAGTKTVRLWRQNLSKRRPYEAEQLLIGSAQTIARLSVLVPIAQQFAIGPEHIGPCLAEVRTDLLDEWCEWAEKTGTDIDVPESGRALELRQFSILLREGWHALRPQIKLAKAVAVLAHGLCHSTRFPPHLVVDDVIRWARTNTPVPSGEEAALRTLCRRIWNGHLPPAPVTAGMMNTVLRVCPSSGARSPGKNLALRRVTCLHLLRWLQAQVTAWHDGIVDIPTDWFRQSGGKKRGVSPANYSRLLMEPFTKLGVLELHQQYSRARHQSTRYRLHLPERGKSSCRIPGVEAESLLTNADGLVSRALDALWAQSSKRTMDRLFPRRTRTTKQPA